MSRPKRLSSLEEIIAIFEALPTAKLGNNYTDEDRARDFLAVFTGQSGPDEGRRVLVQLVDFCSPNPSPLNADKPGLLAFKDGQRWVMGELMRCFVSRRRIPEIEEKESG